MGYRETTNYLGGLEGETGLEPYNGGPQFAPLVDRLIGNAFVMVKVVAQHLNLIKYVAFNMEAVVTVAQNLSAIETAATAASFQTPVTGFSIAMAGGSLILKGAATLAAGTITLPQSALNGQVASISSDITVTALAIAGGTGVTVNGAPTTIAANSGIAFTYELATKIWHRRQ